jgi:hypothetical protein
MKKLSQIKSVLPFREIPNIIGRQRILKELEEKAATAIMSDIQKIVAEGLTEIEPASFIDTLQQLHQEIQGLPFSTTKSNLSQSLRFLVLVIEKRLNQLEVPEHLRAQCEQISNIIGHVPVLNAVVPLPDSEFLPSQFQQSAFSWGKIIWRNPSRESREEKLEFFTRSKAGHKIASVRLYLTHLDQDVRETEALSYAEADFFDIGNLQADHLQPSEHIVKRQMELVAAMNLDPFFRAIVLHEAEGKGYFKEQEGIIYGTKRFYMEYHNCIDNLWFVSTAVGTRKINQDPIEWLEQHERFGAAFFDSIGGGKSINYQGILYTTRDGLILAKATRTWFQIQYGQEIAAAGYILHQIKEPLLRQVEQSTEQHWSKRRSVRLMAKMVTAAQLVACGSQSNSNNHLGQYSSPSSSDAEITDRNLAQMRLVAEKRRSVVAAKADETARDFIEEAKHKKKQKVLERT